MRTEFISNESTLFILHLLCNKTKSTEFTVPQIYNRSIFNEMSKHIFLKKCSATVFIV